MRVIHATGALLVVSVWLLFMGALLALKHEHQHQNQALIQTTLSSTRSSIPIKQTNANLSATTEATIKLSSTINTFDLTTTASSTQEPPATSRESHQKEQNATSSSTISSIATSSSSRNQASKVDSSESLDQMATSQRASFAEPLLMSASQQQQQQVNKQQEQASQHQQQQQQQQQQGSLSSLKSSANFGSATSGSSISNRWTHFGARLRPLTGSLDHQTAAANSKSFLAGSGFQQASQQTSNGNGKQRVLNKGRSGNNQEIVSSNQNQLDSADGDLDDADDQDSEALLYKMMQQQSFLLSPSWQDQAQAQAEAPTQNGNRRANFASQIGATYNGNNKKQQLLEVPESGSALVSLNKDEPSSRKVIKLLKSYSHIHQVDDSDDQIRGTYQRLAARRPQQQNYNRQQDHTRNRHIPQANGRQQQHIFVSSQPLTSANSHNLASSSRDGEDSDNYYSPPSSNEDQQEGGGQAGGPEEEEFECPNNGIFADEPSGCQAYHVCQSGAQVQEKFLCPLGTLFNNIILTCDFAHNVQCGGKNKQASTARQSPDGLQNIDEPISYKQQPSQVQQQQHQQQQPQVPTSSNRYEQGSYNKPPSSPQQSHWSPSSNQQQQGPRHLNIGNQQPPSQYNRHQAGASSHAKALNSYPKPTRTPASDNSQDDNDDQSEQPLVPATLPPRPMMVHHQQLPYNPPPRAQINNQQEMHQSAHRSQYPNNNNNNNYQQSSTSYQPFTGGYDGASAVTPVFASRDEGTTPVATAVPSQQPELQQSLNLVINHISPTLKQQQQHENNSNKSLQKKVVQVQQQLPAKQQVNHNHHNKPSQKQLASQSNQKAYNNQNYNQNYNNNHNNNNKQQVRAHSASHSKPIHVEPAPQVATNYQLPARGTLVDLTNDNQKSTGVSSEALNDGLLLVVRHDSSSSPIKVVNQQAGYQSMVPKKQHLNNANKKQSSNKISGQAFAVDPSLVKPNNPIDAQLFPNVQKVIAASHNQASVINQTVDYNQSQNRQTGNYANNLLKPQVSPPLAPLAPPRPIIEHTSENSYINTSPVVTQLDSLPVTEQAFTSSSISQGSRLIAQNSVNKHSGAHKNHPRTIKRTKRLKESQLPKQTRELQASTIESRTSVIVHQH